MENTMEKRERVMQYEYIIDSGQLDDKPEERQEMLKAIFKLRLLIALDESIDGVWDCE